MENTRTLWKKIVIFLLIILCVIFLHSIKILKPAEGFIAVILEPLQAPLYHLSLIVSDKELLEDKQNLIAENNQLENDINDLILKNTELKNTLKKNDILKEQVDFLTAHNYQYETAKIISRFSENDSQILIINRGKKQNIKTGFAVVAQKGILIGKVIETDVNTAKVLLATSNLSQIAARVQDNEKDVPGLVKGQHGLSLSMNLISKYDEVNQGDIVITSGAESKIPENLVIGKVDGVENRAEDLFSSAKLIPLIDYNQLTVVSVIIP